MASRSWVLLAQAEPLPAPLLAALQKAGMKVDSVATRAAFETALASRPVDVIMADADFPGLPLPELRKLVAAQAPSVPLVVMAGATSVGAAIEAVKAGAQDYVLKPLVIEDVLFVLQAARVAAGRPAAASGAGQGPGEMIGDSGPMRAIWALVDRAAQSQATVLIGGETGTGKGEIARRIHDRSPRRGGPFVKVQGGALPEALLESELFGYEKGAFTGAAVGKPGRVELAEKGTLFLDEIGDTTPATQVKLLRLVQDREYERLGGTETRRADVRFMVATHRDLPAMVARGEFREDLYYRLNVVRIVMPPLRDRLDDIPALAVHFARLACQNNGVPAVTLSDPAIAALAQQRWPGNVRQLQNLIERLVVLSDAPAISAEDVQRELADHGSVAPAPGTPAGGVETAPREMSAIDLKGAVSKAEKRQIEKALLKGKGNRDLAARLLGVSRRTLYYKLRLYGME
jgi:two-component system response regulator AtoC